MKGFRKICLILALCLLFGAAGCAPYDDLDSGATVRLEIETTADLQAISVSSTYGTVEGSGKQYTVQLERKRDFLITVSAPGYATCNVSVTASDLRSGECDKAVTLVEKTKVHVSVSVSGTREEISVRCQDGTEFEKKGLVFVADLEEDQLKQGVTVSAPQMEPYTTDFSDQSGNYRFATVRLIPLGKKSVEFVNADDSAALVLDEAGKPYSVSSRSDDRGNRTISVLLEKDFTGTLRLMSADVMQLASIVVNASSGSYGNQVDCRMGGKGNYFQIEIQNLMGAAGTFYLQETNGSLQTCNHFSGQEIGVMGCGEVTEPGKVILWFLSDDNRDCRWTELKIGSNPIWLQSDFSEWEVQETFSPYRGILCDEYFLTPLPNQTVQIGGDWEEHEEVSTDETGVFIWDEKYGSVPSLFVEGDYCYFYSYHVLEGELYREARYSREKTWQVSLTKDGVPVTDGDVWRNQKEKPGEVEGTRLSELSEELGVYEWSDSSPNLSQLILEKDGVTRRLSLSELQPEDWTKNPDGSYRISMEVVDRSGVFVEIYGLGGEIVSVSSGKTYETVVIPDRRECFYLYADNSLEELSLDVKALVYDENTNELREETKTFVVNLNEAFSGKGRYTIDWQNKSDKF